MLTKLQKAGGAGCMRASLMGKGKVLQKQEALLELEKEGKIVQKVCGGIVFFFDGAHPPLPPAQVLSALVHQVCREKGAVLWKEADLVRALKKLKHYTLAEATAAAKAFCGSAEMLEVKDGKTRKYLHRSAMPAGGGSLTLGDCFVSESARLIFALVELDGECRQRILGLTSAHYRDAELAKQWRNRVAMQIHPDVCDHPRAHEAANELAVMFKEMTA